MLSNASFMNYDRDQIALGVNNYVLLPAFDFLVSVKPPVRIRMMRNPDTSRVDDAHAQALLVTGFDAYLGLVYQEVPQCHPRSPTSRSNNTRSVKEPDP